MKLLLDNGTEIPIENIKVTNVKEGDKIIADLGSEKVIPVHRLREIRQILIDFFKVPILLMHNGIKLEVMNDN